MSEVNKPVVHMSTGRPEAGAYYASLYSAAQSELAALREENERLKNESFEGLYNAAIDERDALREELATAKDDLVIFKGGLSALGEASKKLVFCARTTGGAAGSDQGLMDACASVEGVITLAGIARAMDELEQLTAERDALQLRLNAADQRIDELTNKARSEAGDALVLIVDHQQFIAGEYEDLIDKASDFQDRAYALGIARGILRSAERNIPQ